MLVDVRNDWFGHNIPQRKVPLAHQSNLCTRNIILLIQLVYTSVDKEKLPIQMG